MWLLLLVLRLMNWLQTAMLPPALRIADMAFGGHSMAEVVRTTAALGLADQLAQGPKTALALARDIGVGMHHMIALSMDTPLCTPWSEERGSEQTSPGCTSCLSLQLRSRTS